MGGDEKVIKGNQMWAGALHAPGQIKTRPTGSSSSIAVVSMSLDKYVERNAWLECVGMETRRIIYYSRSVYTNIPRW